MQRVVVADKLFTGEGWLQGHGLVLDKGSIQNILAPGSVPSNAEVFKDAFIAPAFIDVQVYGAAEKLLAVEPTTETLQVMYDVFSKTGTALFQPTLATNTLDVFRKSIDAVRAYWKEGGKGVFGLHLEGPWLNELKRGAHVKELIHSPSMEEVKELLKYGEGVISMITIAPEVVSDEIIDYIRSKNIILSAGHSNATYEQATAVFDKGITTVTHLYNAMSGLQHRAPGLVGAVFNHKSVMSSVIPDGYHVDFAAIAIAKKMMGSRLFAITDAVTETREGYYRHHLAGDKYECNGVLSGSALSMYQAFLNLVEKLEIEVEEAHRMCSLYPAQVLKCEHQYGRIQKNAKAELVVLGKELQLVEVISQ